MVKIKKRPKDGNGRPNDLPGGEISENGQQQQQQTGDGAVNLQGRKMDQQNGGENVRQSGVGENQINNTPNGRRNDRFKNRTVELEPSQQQQPDDYEGSQENGLRGRGKGPLNEHPRSFDTNLTNVPTTLQPGSELPFHFFTTVRPESSDRNGNVDQSSAEQESPPYSNVNIQTPRPKERSTTEPTQIVEGILVKSTDNLTRTQFSTTRAPNVIVDGNQIGLTGKSNETSFTGRQFTDATANNNSVLVGRVTPISRFDTVTTLSGASTTQPSSTTTSTTTSSTTTTTLQTTTTTTTTVQTTTTTKTTAQTTTTTNLKSLTTLSSDVRGESSTSKIDFDEADNTFTITSNNRSIVPQIEGNNQPIGNRENFQPSTGISIFFSFALSYFFSVIFRSLRLVCFLFFKLSRYTD